MKDLHCNTSHICVDYLNGMAIVNFEKDVPDHPIDPREQRIQPYRKL